MKLTSIRVSEKRIFKYHDSEMVAFEATASVDLNSDDAKNPVGAAGHVFTVLIDPVLNNRIDQYAKDNKSFRLAKDVQQPEIIKSLERQLKRRERESV